ncbi:MAG: methyltransferase [Lachnospirales bacterium]
MGTDKINSKEYWEKRFKTDWVENGGCEQTMYFTNTALSLMPSWFTSNFRNNNYSLCDIGCGMGGGTKIFKENFPDLSMTGYDVSDAAIEFARENYENINFEKLDLLEEDLKINKTYNIVYSSNTLEHFENYKEILKTLSTFSKEFVVILVPFKEGVRVDIDGNVNIKYKLVEEHETLFQTDNIYSQIFDLTLIYAKSAKSTNTEIYSERQILLIYKKTDLVKTAVLANISEFITTNKVEHLELLYEDCNFRINQLEYDKDQLSQGKQSEIQKNKIILQEKDNLVKEKEDLVKEKEDLTEERDILYKDNEVIKDEKEALLKEIENLHSDLVQQKEEYKDLRFVYDDLYSQHAHLNSKLYDLKNSNSYKTGLAVKKIVYPFYFIARKILGKIKRILIGIKKGNWDDVKLELFNVFIKMSNARKEKKAYEKTVSRFVDSINGKKVIILPPTIDWNITLFQRPQQLAVAYAKKENVAVLYLTSNMTHDNVYFANEIRENLWLVNAGKLDKINSFLENAKETIISISWAINKNYLERINHDKFIYEYIDELSIFHMYDEQMEVDHKYLLSKANVTVCTANKLYESVLPYAKNPIISTNGGDYEFFANTKNVEINKLIAEKIKPYKAVIGYYGALAEWFDYELLKEVAKARQDWCFVLVGYNYDNTLNTSGILDVKNIIHVPAQPYKELPSFLNAFDIATVPFLINEITLSTSPVKLFEYMAAEKPIMCSKMPECLKYESAKIYGNAEEFIKIAENLLSLEDNDEYFSILKKEALENTWEAKTDEILGNIK